MGGSSGVDIKDSEDQKAMADIARQKWNTYQSEFVPAENKWMQDVASWNDESNYNEAAAVGSLNTNSAYGEAMKQLVSQGGNSAKLNTGINQLALGINSARSENVNRMQINQQNQYIAGLQNINNLGLGKETQALGTLSDAAGISQQYATQAAKNSYSDSNSWNELAGMGIGAATRGAV